MRILFAVPQSSHHQQRVLFLRVRQKQNSESVDVLHPAACDGESEAGHHDAAAADVNICP